MGNGTSIPEEYDAASMQQRESPPGSPTGRRGKIQSVVGSIYYCCLLSGNQYRRSPNHRDLNEEAGVVQFKEGVRPIAKLGDWLKVSEEKWLPMVFFWGPRDEDGRMIELMRLYDPKASSPLARAPPAYSDKWSILDETVKAVKVTDAIDSVLDYMETLHLSAIKKIQAAERRRQKRKKKKRQKKEKRQAELKAKELEIQRLKEQLASQQSSTAKSNAVKPEESKVVTDEPKELDPERQKEIAKVTAARNTLGHAILAPIQRPNTESKTKS